MKIAGLTKIIDRKVLLKDVNVSIPENSLVAILGKNGAGKSTFIKCIAGLYKIDHGSITVSGLNWDKKNDKKIKRLISYIPDKSNFDYNLTVEQNILHHASLYGINEKRVKNKVDDLFKFFDLYERKNDTINHYSLGMQKKALIIRGLISEPQILVLDEPTNGLDPGAEKDFIDKLFELNKQGITIILSTQSLNIAKRFGISIYIEEGMVREISANKISDQTDLNFISVETQPMDLEQIEKTQITINKHEFIAKIKTGNNCIKIELSNNESYVISKLINDILMLDISIIKIEIKNDNLKNYEEYLHGIEGS
jgi:ABC-type multidrug transport system ATPase subunit